MVLARNVDPNQFTGLTGWVASVIDSLGAVGVALLVALESVIPPIPSEIVLAMAGYLAAEGRFSVVLIVLAATAGRCSARCCSTGSAPRSARSG